MANVKETQNTKKPLTMAVAAVVAVIVDIPFPTAFIFPVFLSTLATVVSELVHVTFLLVAFSGVIV